MFEQNKRIEESNTHYAYRQLKEAIMTLKLSPGANIDEKRIAEQFGISRTPVREALLRLREEHLIDVQSQAHTRVSLIDYDLVQDAIFIRDAIETQVQIKLCGCLDPAYHLRLRENLNRQKFCVDNPDMRPEYFSLDNSFHHLIFEAAGCSFAWSLLKTACTHLDRVRYLHVLDPTSSGSIPKLYNDHAKMLDLITENSRDEIREILHQHIRFRPSTIWSLTNAETASFFINVPPDTARQHAVTS